ARKLTLLVLGVAYERFHSQLEQQQEVLAGITDIALETLLMDSVALRARKLAAVGKGDFASDMCGVFVREAMEKVESTARAVLAASSEGDALRANLAVLRRFAKFEPVDAFAIRRRIAARLLEAGRYLV
ncbi:MAG: acyl-CoA dehydrogenase, partial [bacterium]|nr:acyl-CoA dehydrogenase [bacterium]